MGFLTVGAGVAGYMKEKDVLSEPKFIWPLCLAARARGSAMSNLTVFFFLEELGACDVGLARGVGVGVGL